MFLEELVVEAGGKLRVWKFVVIYEMELELSLILAPAGQGPSQFYPAYCLEFSPKQFLQFLHSENLSGCVPSLLDLSH